MNYKDTDPLEPTPYLVEILEQFEQDIANNGGGVDADHWENIIDFTEIDKEGVDAKDLLKRL